ncbi:unnamed protein product [Mytilus coruscus]|uniref:Endonuclease/exonuclease/phosphatase domain-containing protein n=1 Tax=Mytilus coruscus TaxID=42192 RepID=A0A6J8BXC0_MYTCO|nr:unnamed protein product [Mytilus coruscus]
MLEKFKYELEIRDIKIGHQMEMMELKNKVSLLEMQQTITDRLEKKINKDDTNVKRHDEGYSTSRHIANIHPTNIVQDQSPSIRDCINNEQNKASACQKNQQIEHHCESLGTQRTSNERDILKNNSEPTSYIQNRTCIEDQEAVRRAQGAQMYMNAPTRYHGAPPLIRTEQNHVNNINGKDVLENYYKKYPSQREINENLQTQRSAGNGSNGQNTEIRLPKPSMPNMRPSKENKNHFLEIGPGKQKEATQVTIGTFNVQSVKGNMTYLKQLLKKLDLCCLQEHWLFKPEQHLLHDIDTNMIVTAKSIDDENPELSMIARRGYGGVAILWKKEMDDKISVMVDGSNRIQVIQMETDNTPLCLINVYMPSDNKDMDNEYKDTLAQMTEIIKKIQEHS